MNYLHTTILIIAGGLMLASVGHITNDTQAAVHPNNPFWLKGSPLGKIISKLANRSIDQNWENGASALPEVNPDATELPFDSIPSISKKLGLCTDLLVTSLNERTYASPLIGAMQTKLRDKIKKQIYYGFDLDPTSGPALQTSMLFLTEMDNPQLDNDKLRLQRIEETEKFFKKAFDAYNLDPKTGNPDHFVNAAEALFSRLLTRLTLDNNYNMEDNKTKPLRQELSAKIGKDMNKYLDGALAIQLLQQKQGIWAKRSDYRKQDFWAGLQFVSRLSKSIGVDAPTSNHDVIQLRIGDQLKDKSPEEAETLIQKFTQETFGKVLRKLYDPVHKHDEPGHEGHNHGPGGHEAEPKQKNEPGHEGHNHGPGEECPTQKKENGHEGHKHGPDCHEKHF